MLDQELILALLGSSGLVGSFLVPFISFLKGVFRLDENPQTVTKRRVKTFLSIATSLVSGVLVVLVIGDPQIVNIEGLLLSSAIVFTSATIAYKTFWQDTDSERATESLGKRS